MTGRIPESAVDEVLARTDLRAIAEPYVTLQRKGGRFFGLCPFHKEKTPSFSLSSAEGLFYCFGCGAGGSAIQFLMRIEGWTFTETIGELASRAGVDLPEMSSADNSGTKKRKEAYFQVMENACQFFEAQLYGSRGEAALEYLKERGVDEKTARSFRLGCAQPEWTALIDALKRKNIDGHEVEEAGLAIGRKSGGFYDRFRDRIMFPVVDKMGRVVGFSGRTMSAEESQKYINSPDLEYYKKGEHLYGIQAAKESLRHERHAVLVEGNFDVVTLHAAGVNSALAPLGTALTGRQVSLLKRISDRVTLVFDGDNAGRKAMLRCMAPCYKIELNVNAALLPSGEDPDSFVRKNGAEAFNELIEKARPLAEVVVDDAISSAVGANPEERVSAAKKALKSLEDVPSGPIRRSYLEEVGRRLEFTWDEISRMGDSRRRRYQEKSSTESGVEEKISLSHKERQLIQIMVDEPGMIGAYLKADEQLGLVRKEIRPIVEKLTRLEERADSVRLERLLSELDLSLRTAILEAIMMPRDYGPNEQSAMKKTLRALQVNQVKTKKKAIMEELRLIEQGGDDLRFDELIRQDRDLTQQLQELKSEGLSLL